LPQAKKKAKAKAAKPVSSGVRKAPAASAAGRHTATAKVKNSGTMNDRQSKKVSAKKSPAQKSHEKKPLNKKTSGKKSENNPTSSRASAKLKSTTVNKKINPTKTAGKEPAAGTAARIMPSSKSLAGQKPTTGSASKKLKPAPAKAEKSVNRTDEHLTDAPHPIETKASEAASAVGNGEKKPAIGKTAPDKSPARARTRRQASGSSDSVGQGLGKQVPKKRGWRDIEALTERARLKSLLSDIWHEDIDLDSDIFGETDHLFGYYTDKEEVIEVDPEADEEWEEFEEDES